MKLNCYINLVERNGRPSSLRLPFILDDGTLFLAFRGTDETIVGWKEDFNMAFLESGAGAGVQCQICKYGHRMAASALYIGGHSKGGNLAVYSAMKCAPFVQKRIQKIYSLDGPGFRPESAEGVSLQCDRRQGGESCLPHSSMIGMIFERDIHYA